MVVLTGHPASRLAVTVLCALRLIHVQERMGKRRTNRMVEIKSIGLKVYAD